MPKAKAQEAPRRVSAGINAVAGSETVEAAPPSLNFERLQ
jgi:hypothetical protein